MLCVLDFPLTACVWAAGSGIVLRYRMICDSPAIGSISSLQRTLVIVGTHAYS